MLGTITGRLVRDAEVKTVNTKDGDKSVCEFSIAANNRYGAKTEASFYNCSLWGAKGEAVAKYHKKGDFITVNGYLEQEEYEKDGDKKRVWKFYAISFEFCKSGDGKASESNQIDSTPTDTDDIPF